MIRHRFISTPNYLFPTLTFNHWLQSLVSIIQLLVTREYTRFSIDYWLQESNHLETCGGYLVFEVFVLFIASISP